MAIARKDVTMDTLKKQDYKAAYVPDDDTLVYCNDQFTINEMTRKYIEACHNGTPIRFVNQTIGNVRYRLTQPIGNWFTPTLWFAKMLEEVEHDEPQAEKTQNLKEIFQDYDPVTTKGLEREFAR